MTNEINILKISNTSSKKDINDTDDIIAFLNSSAESFYKGRFRFLRSSFKNYFKGFLQSELVDIERTIRGTFECGFFLSEPQVQTVSELKPPDSLGWR